jgi:hypothetical protein
VSGARKAAVLLARAFNKRQFKFQVKSKKVTFLFLSTDNANNVHCIALLTKANENKKHKLLFKRKRNKPKIKERHFPLNLFSFNCLIKNY